MRKLITLFVILSFLFIAAPVRAGLITEFDPVEKNLVEKKQLEEDLGSEFKKPAAGPMREEPKLQAKSGSNWWKWTLGIVVLGALAAGGGGGGGNDGGGSGSGSTVTGSW